MIKSIMDLADQMAAAHAFSIAVSGQYPEQAGVHASRVAAIRAQLLLKLEEFENRTVTSLLN